MRVVRLLIVFTLLTAHVSTVAGADPNSPTIDGQFSGAGPIPAGATRNLVVTGRGGVPATGVGAVALNVTVTNPSASSYLAVWPTGQPRPNAANLNYTPDQTVPNMVIAKVGDGGQISIFNLAGTADVIVDVLGWFPTGATFTGLTPARLMDSRTSITQPKHLICQRGSVTGGIPAAADARFNGTALYDVICAGRWVYVVYAGSPSSGSAAAGAGALMNVDTLKGLSFSSNYPMNLRCLTDATHDPVVASFIGSGLRDEGPCTEAVPF